jgi:hypothetical protein
MVGLGLSGGHCCDKTTCQLNAAALAFNFPKGTKTVSKLNSPSTFFPFMEISLVEFYLKVPS